MATTPSAFFKDSGAPEAVSYALKNGAKSFTKLYQDTARADQFVGTKGNDIFVLGAGDKIKSSGGGYDAVVTDHSFSIGGTGIDAVKLTGSTNVNVTGDNADNNLFGNAGANTIKGQAGEDVVAGGTGNDKLYGGAGADTVLGGSGDDKAYGDSGKDLVRGGEGNDSVYGGSDDDKVYGDAGNDKVYGDAGNDKVYGDAGNDSVYGGSGNDSVYGGADDDKLYGDSGNDKLFGGAGDDILTGGAGNDTIVGDKGSNTFIGGSGRDVFEIAKQTGEIDTIRDFRAGQDVIDLSDTSANSMRDLKFTAEKDGTLVEVKGGVQIKLIGFDPDEIKSSFFDF
ncbi:calcium-binding protein [Microvirga terrestris]|uniref:Calcium-binding protein n=1 Tax=Microvirga terrestris TaxID=2791024 RepID=A0ABS0HV05_9HYPH|nr:calcium-binding protein [Microvirga terrestris]MBF9197337.1 hypothetical protein [Microvirga terrestris]